MSGFKIRRIREVDRAFVERLCQGADPRAHDLPGFVALRGSEPVGLLVYNTLEGDCEIVLLYTAIERIGLGSSLMREVKKAARRTRSARIWVTVAAGEERLRRFYERNGFRARDPGEEPLRLEQTLGTRSPDTTAL